MKYIDVPYTQLHVSQICLGSTDIGASISVRDSFALMDEFVARGGNFIDTAHVYSDWIPNTKSTSEKTIGQWLKARSNRNQIVLATKGAHPDLATMHVPRLSPAEIVQDLTESLDYLQTDVIDLYFLHRDHRSIPVGEIIDVLDEQVRAGRIRYLGASNWSIPRIQEAVDYGKRTGKHTLIANQPLWSLAVPNLALHFDQTLIAMDAAGMEFHRRTQMLAVAYSSQARGFFSKMDATGQRAIGKDDWVLFNNQANFKRLERCRELSRKHGVAINDVVLAYLLSQPFPTVPIIGSKRLDQLHSSLKALDLTLTPDELAYLEAN